MLPANTRAYAAMSNVLCANNVVIEIIELYGLHGDSSLQVSNLQHCKSTQRKVNEAMMKNKNK